MADSDKTPSLSYRDAGVDIDAGNRLIERIKPYAQRTRRPGVMAGLGGFGALFELPTDRYKHPVLVSGTDGVGTKLKLALELGIHDSIGIDLVAMCVNDIVVTGAEPLFFLDYYATGKLDIDVAADVIKGISAGCEQAGAALTGGETAEMPGMYGEGDYDLAGFCVGVVEKDRLIDGSRVKAGDALIALGSSGPHSNGYSLIRRILEHGNTPLDTPLGETTLGAALLAPTQIYVKPLLALLAAHDIHALAHITGGGLTENLPRVLPRGLKARINTHAWTRPHVFHWLQKAGNVEEAEMLRTFNCGVGMCVVLAEDQVDSALEHFSNQGIAAWRIGSIEPSEDAEAHVEYMTE